MQSLIVQDIWFKANCTNGLQVPELKITEEQMMLLKTSFQLAQRTCQILAALRHWGRDGAGKAFVSELRCWCPCQGRYGGSHQGSALSRHLILR